MVNLKRRKILAWGSGWATAGLIGAPLIAGSSVAAAAESGPASVTFMLDFNVMGRHAPWYVALDKGYFKAAGLDVKIVPGQGTAQSLQALEAGVAQFSFSDVAALVMGRAQGVSTGRFVEMNYQKAPYAVYSLKSGANITSLSQLPGKEIASSSSSNTPKIIEGLMAEKGLDPKSVKFTNVAGSARPGLLLSGKIPAMETFIFGKIGMEKNAKPGELVTMLLADQGLTLYSDGVLVKESYLKAHPDLVRGFVTASIKGWHDALNNMDEAATIEQKYAPSLDKSVIVGELEILKDMAVIPAVKTHGLGYIDPEQMRKSVEFVTRNIGVTGTVPPVQDLYTNEFMPKPPVLP